LARAYVVVGRYDSGDGERDDWIERVVWSEARAAEACAEARDRDHRLRVAKNFYYDHMRAWERRNPRPERDPALSEEEYRRDVLHPWGDRRRAAEAEYEAAHPDCLLKSKAPGYCVGDAVYSHEEVEAEGGGDGDAEAAEAARQAVAQERGIREDETMGQYAARVAARAIDLFRNLGARRR